MPSLPGRGAAGFTHHQACLLVQPVADTHVHCMQLDNVSAPSNGHNVSINVPPSVVAANSLPWRRNGVHVN